MVSKLYIYNEKIVQCLLNIIMPQYYKKIKPVDVREKRKYSHKEMVSLGQ